MIDSDTPLTPAETAKLLDWSQRIAVMNRIYDVQMTPGLDPGIAAVLLEAAGWICDAGRLVDQTRAELAELKAHEDEMVEMNFDFANEAVAAEDKAKRLEAENTKLWEGIANLHDHLTDDQITTELRRQGIEITELPEVIKLARAKQRDGG